MAGWFRYDCGSRLSGRCVKIGKEILVLVGSEVG